MLGDHLDGAGDFQKIEAEDSELVEEELDEEPDGNENLASEEDDGVASSFGDFS